MNYLNLIAAVIVAAAIIITKLLDSADERRRVAALERLSDKECLISKENLQAAITRNHAAEWDALAEKERRKKAELDAKIEELKLERTRLLQNLSDTDKEAFEKLLNAPLIEKTEVKPVQVPVPMPDPMPCWWGTYTRWWGTSF